MSDLKYEPIYLRTERASGIDSGNPEGVAKALYAATKYEQDWSWVQNQCLQALTSTEVSVRWAAATCLGDLAFCRRPLDCDRVIPALEQAAIDPQISDPASFSLSLVRQFLQSK
jgi:hypothetical protein